MGCLDENCGLGGGDPFGTQLERAQEVMIIGDFAISIYQREHSYTRHIDPLVAGTVGKAISNMAKIFLNNYIPDPKKSVDGATHSCITFIIKSFRRINPDKKNRKPSPP